MFIGKKINNLRTLQSNSNWIATNKINYQRHIYEDIFIRKYIASLVLKWVKYSTYKILGSFYLVRTFGKIWIHMYFFCPILKISQRISPTFKKGFKQSFNFRNIIQRPIAKCKKNLSIILLFYRLEKILGIQVFFKFINICNKPVQGQHLESTCLVKLYNGLSTRLSYFKFQFKGLVYTSTILCLVHLFKFKNPDGELLAHYIAYSLSRLQKHTSFLIFVKKILQLLQKFFKFTGIKILLSGKLNGFSRAQSKQIQVGRVSLQSINTPYRDTYSHAFTTAGKIGVKVWLC